MEAEINDAMCRTTNIEQNQVITMTGYQKNALLPSVPGDAEHKTDLAVGLGSVLISESLSRTIHKSFLVPEKPKRSYIRDRCHKNCDIIEYTMKFWAKPDQIREDGSIRWLWQKCEMPLLPIFRSTAWDADYTARVGCCAKGEC